MGTMKEHLAGFHKVTAGRHEHLAKCFGKLAGMAKAAKSQMKDDDEEDGVCGTLQKISDAFADGATYHKLAMQECSKADVADELNKAAAPEFEKRLCHLEDTLIPTKVSAVVPNRPGITAVPRAGQQQIPTRPEVPIQFEHLVKIGDED